MERLRAGLWAPERSSTAVAYVGELAGDRPRRRSLEALQRALTRTTEALAIELGRPGTKAPEWSEAEWAIARAVAAIHGVSPLLARTLRWQGPQSWTRFLETQTLHTAQRFVRIQRLMQLIDGRAREAAIPVVPLKGAAMHALGIYAPGERPMADIDLLVREERSTRFAELLVALGFTETLRTWKHRVFSRANDAEPAPLGEHADNGIKIELHCRIAEELPRRKVDVTSSVFPESPRPGFNCYASKAALLLHVLLHTAGALVLREVRLLQLYDIARLAGVAGAADWEELSLQAGRAGDRSLWWAFPALTLANRYFGCVPDRVLRHAAADCHWALKRAYGRRTLSRSSLSHLWVSALPGISWARSPGEMVAYAAARTVPDGEPLLRRKTLSEAEPRSAGVSWSQLSQGERIVRWILSRQARRATLQPVRAALRATPG
jgi:hypothetical protein